MSVMAEVHRPVRTLLYCQHSLGIGHLMRTLALAEELIELGPVMVICGGQVPARLAVDPRLAIVQLPVLDMNLDGTLLHASGPAGVDDSLKRRAAEAVTAACAFAPDVAVVEMFPFGRKKFAAEILAMIEALRARGPIKILCSVRDVLVTKRKDQARHDSIAAQRLNEHFDGVLVHSDPDFVRLDKTFSEFAALRIPVHYTGYVARHQASVEQASVGDRLVVSAGGGRVGATLLRAALAASREVFAATGLRTLLLGGSLSVESLTIPAGAHWVDLVPAVADLRSLLARSAVSVSQCGYNTVADILGAGVPAVVVPFETEREDEQLRRAELLERRGRVTVLRERDLSADTLAAAIGALPRARCSALVNLAGAAATRRAVAEVARHA